MVAVSPKHEKAAKSVLVTPECSLARHRKIYHSPRRKTMAGMR